MTSSIPPLDLPDNGTRPTAVCCIGHALVDRLAGATPEVVAAAGMELGAMTLVDAAGAAALEHARDDWQEAAGGSAANTAAGVASFGGRAAFVGSIGADEAGKRYAADLEEIGVRSTCRPVSTGDPTGSCHVLVTAGGGRSMATHLGAAGRVDPAAVDEAALEQACVVYLEGYLLDAPLATSAVERALEVARAARTLVALSLSDPFVVERHRDRIRELVLGGAVDVLFGNEEEVATLTGKASLDGALVSLEQALLLGFVTRGPAGSVAWRGVEREVVPARPVELVVDTTGAGDLYAAGVLHGLTCGQDAALAARLGSIAASEVISHFGARPLTPLAALTGSIG